MTLAGSTVLVTGATGFVGGALTRRLAADGAHVRALARTPEKAAFLAGQPRVEIVHGDITNAVCCAEVCQGCDVVFHVAAALGGPIAMQRRVNVEGTRHVVRAAAEAGAARLVHISSIAIYGYGHRGVITEDTAPRPTHDPYSLTKREGEGVVQVAARERDLSYTVIRPGTIYGPRSNAWTRKMFMLVRRPPLIFVGNGRGSIPAIYVDDLIDLCVVAATHPAAANQIFNGTPDPSPTWREYLGGYAALAGVRGWWPVPVAPVRWALRLRAAFAPPETRLKALPEFVSFLTEPVTYSMAKARACLNWAPSTPLAEGIARSAPWLRDLGLLAR